MSKQKLKIELKLLNIEEIDFNNSSQQIKR